MYKMENGQSDTESDKTDLQQSNVIKPQMNETTARDLVNVLFGMEVISIKEMPSYNDRNYYIKVKIEGNNNECKERQWPHGYTLKITNSLESRKTHIDAEHKLQRVLHNHGIPCPLPVPNLHGKEKSLQVIYKPISFDEWPKKFGEEGERSYNEHAVRLLTFIPGDVLLSVPYTPSLFHNAGRMLGKIDSILQTTEFDSATYAELNSLLDIRVWDLTNTPKTLKKYVYVVKDPRDNALICEILNAFETQVQPKYHKLTKGIIHGDFNEQNIIVRSIPTNPDQSEREYDVCGVLDFQDSTLSYYIFDVAVSICYLMVECNDINPLDVGGHFLAGYTKHFSLNEDDLDVLKICIASRLAMSMVMGMYTSSLDPGNQHILTTQVNGWKKLKLLWPVQKEDLYEHWKNIIGSYTR